MPQTSGERDSELSRTSCQFAAGNTRIVHKVMPIARPQRQPASSPDGRCRRRLPGTGERAYNPFLRIGEKVIMRVVRKALTFDDVLLVPAHSLVVPRDVSLQTRLTRTISLNIPLLSAAMDTVTEARLAIAIAQEGGIGIVHKNMTPRAQAAEVAKVKRFESGVVKDPITVPPTMSVREVLALTRQHRISGLAGRRGQARSSASSPTATCASRPTSTSRSPNIMTQRDRLVTVPEGTDLETREGADAPAPARARAGRQRRASSCAA